MKDILNTLFAILCIAFSFPHSAFSQKDLTDELHYEVNRAYPYISKTKSTG